MNERTKFQGFPWWALFPLILLVTGSVFYGYSVGLEIGNSRGRAEQAKIDAAKPPAARAGYTTSQLFAFDDNDISITAPDGWTFFFNCPVVDASNKRLSIGCTEERAFQAIERCKKVGQYLSGPPDWKCIDSPSAPAPKPSKGSAPATKDDAREAIETAYMRGWKDGCMASLSPSRAAKPYQCEPPVAASKPQPAPESKIPHCNGEPCVYMPLSTYQEFEAIVEKVCPSLMFDGVTGQCENPSSSGPFIPLCSAYNTETGEATCKPQPPRDCECHPDENGTLTCTCSTGEAIHISGDTAKPQPEVPQ